MIPKQFERFELAGKLYIWTNPRSPLLRNDEIGNIELWVRSVGPRTALTDLIRNDRGLWFLVQQRDIFKADTKTYQDISEKEAAALLQQCGAMIPADGTKQDKKATINMRMMEKIQRDPDAMGWKTTEWQKFLKCRSRSVITDTPTWKNLENHRLTVKAEKRKSKRRRPRHYGSDRD